MAINVPVIFLGIACVLLGYFLGSNQYGSHPLPLDHVDNFDLHVSDYDGRRQLRLLDPKTVEARPISPLLTSDVNINSASLTPYSERILPPCNLMDVGIGRWTYQHRDAVFIKECPPDRPRCRGEGSQFPFKEADPTTATWTPLRCSLPHLDWRPSAVLECAAVKNVKNIVVLGGSTSRYFLGDFRKWIENSINNEANNVHSKEQISTSILGGALHLEAIQQTSANPNTRWNIFFHNPKFFENTLVIFNSVLWDMRMNDFHKYEQDVNNLAEAFAQYKRDHPTNRVIWRASGTPNWNRLDVEQGFARARERLLNPDSVMVYNTVAAEAMLSRGIEVFDDYYMVLGRPEETRGPNDGLHPSTNMNIELMRLLLSVLCNE